MCPSPSFSGCAGYQLPSGPASPPEREDELELIGSSVAMARLRLQVDRIGPHFRTVLLRGEQGTERELVARRLHRLSVAAAGAFVMCHAGALEDALPAKLRSSASADASACSRSATVLESLTVTAEGGTLFLDGVEELPLDAQVRLLRTLRRHEFAESGGNMTPRRGFRVIASTSEELRVLASANRFGNELYQCLATVEIALPSLRDRLEDIPQLIHHLQARLAAVHGCSICSVSPEAMQRLLHYSWPGNVRELEDLLRSVLMQREGRRIEAHHLPAFAPVAIATPAKQEHEPSVRLEHVIERHVMRVLIDCGGNKLRAAERLGISRSTLYRMLDSSATPQVPQ